MPEPKTPREPKPEKHEADAHFEKLISSIERYASEVGSLAADAAPQGEHRELIISTSASLTEQVGNAATFSRESFARLAAPQKAEMLPFLRVQTAPGLVDRGLKTAASLIRGGVVRRLIRWLAQHLSELKKILKEVIHLICDLLHIDYPSWFDRILLIMDQVLHLLLSLLAEVFGIDFGDAAHDLSRHERNFLNEMAAFESMRIAQRRGPALAEEN